MRLHGRQVLPASGGKVIQDRDRLARGQQTFDQMRPNETRPAGDEDAGSVAHGP